MQRQPILRPQQPGDARVLKLHAQSVCRVQLFTGQQQLPMPELQRWIKPGWRQLRGEHN